MADHDETKPEAERKDELASGELFDPWERQLSFDRQSHLLSPVRRDGDDKSD